MKLVILDSATKEEKVPAIRSQDPAFINETYSRYVVKMAKEKSDFDMVSSTMVDDHIVTVYNNGIEIHIYPKG